MGVAAYVPNGNTAQIFRIDESVLEKSPNDSDALAGEL